MKSLEINMKNTGYLYEAFPHSVMALRDDYHAWTHCYYLLLGISKNAGLARGEFWASIAIKQFIYDLNIFPQLNIVQISNAEMDRSHFIATIINWINEGHYVYISLDEYYIPYRDKDYHYTHESLIYGYDSQEETFHVLGFDGQYKFGQYHIDYSDLTNGFFSEYKEHAYRELLESTYLLQLNDAASIEFDINAVLEFIDLYLNPRSFETHSEGKDVYTNFYTYIDNMKNNIEHINWDAIIAFYIFKENKHNIRNLVAYLVSNKIIGDAEELLNRFTVINKHAGMISNSILFALQTKNIKYFERVISLLNMIQLEELDCITLLKEKINVNASLNYPRTDFKYYK